MVILSKRAEVARFLSKMAWLLGHALEGGVLFLFEAQKNS